MYAVLHVPHFSLQAILRTEPAGRGPPVALLAHDKRKALVLAVTPAAAAAGVEAGLTAAQAQARCPQLTFRTPSPSAEAEARAALLASGFLLAPLVEDTAPGLGTADCRALPAAAFGPAADRALGELRALGIAATLGAGATPLLARYAACAAARRQVEALDASPLLIVTEARDFLRDLPLAVADPSREQAEILEAWGLRTLGDLAGLPCEDIARRLGQEGVALWQRANGGQPRPLRAHLPDPTFAATLDFEEPVETLEPLLFVLKRLLDRLTLELATHHLVAHEAVLTLPLANETRETRAFRLPEPTGEAEILFRAIHSFLESLHTPEAIAGIRLQLIPVRPLVRQTGLFETGLRDPHAFGETLARIAALVGPENVGAPQLLDTHRPDAVQLVTPPPVIPAPPPPPLRPPLGPPLRRFRPPLPAKLELTAGQPTYVWTPRFADAIVALHGPWSASGDWWQVDRRWQRHEWDIALARGGLYRLLLSGETYVIEGEYD